MLTPPIKRFQLKDGAQIMFIKNDKGESRRFSMVKLAPFKIITEEIYMRFPSDEHEMLLEKETWENIRYQL